MTRAAAMMLLADGAVPDTFCTTPLRSQTKMAAKAVFRSRAFAIS